jgi:hypothetical protein
VAEFDFDAARRWARFDPQRTLTRRSDNELPFVNPSLLGGQGLLLDTSVYIDQMQGRSPQILDDLIAQRQVNHSTVAMQKLMHTIGVLNPTRVSRPSWTWSVSRLEQCSRIASLHRTRRFWDALRCCGTLCRLQGYEREGKLRACKDCALFLQAQKLGLVVLTANVGDHDVLLQLIPTGRTLFYRSE